MLTSIILLRFQYPVFCVLVLAPSLGIRDIWDFFSSNLNNEIDLFLLSPLSQYSTPPLPPSPYLATRLSAYEKRPPSPNLSTGKFQLVQLHPKLKGSV